MFRQNADLWLLVMMIMLTLVFGWTGERDRQDFEAAAGFAPADYRLSAYVWTDE